MIASRAGLLLAVSLGILGWAQPAFGFCRETVKTTSDGPCIEEPGAARLHWTRGCMTYAFNRDFFERLELLDEESVRAEFQRSYDTWAAVDCGSTGKPFFVEQSRTLTAVDASEFLRDADAENISVVIARTKAEWVEKELGERVIALTVLWHHPSSGEIFDVDMQLNLGMGDFTNCRDKCGVGEVDLRNTIMHEGGHLLGLGHSMVFGSTMFDNNSSPGDIEKRTLDLDDENGYCALDLPAFKCQGEDCSCPAPPPVSGTRTRKTCGCTVPGAGDTPAAAGVLFALASALIARRRRRRAA